MTMRAIRYFAIFLWMIIWPVIGQAITLEAYAKNPDGYILFIRHALAPGTGDPSHFRLQDCQTQRNLSQQGVDQAKELGAQLSQAGLKIADIFTSQWCRCKDTARALALGEVIEEPGLNSFYQDFAPKKETLARLRQKLSQIDEAKGITIMVTHFVTISAITGIGVSSGGMVSYNPKTGHAMPIEGK